ncbi:hypothetical protein AAU57_07680 [Nonlabens sp. YIK11]|nr:hypothetical protein AAU57_07680 [Nonlabens sp. YIK11]
MIGCSDSKQNLIVVEDDHDIDLTQLDSVRDNLNGFWILEDVLDEENLLYLDFDKENNVTSWETIPFSREIEQSGVIPMISCRPWVTIIKPHDKVELEFVGLYYSDTLEIESLSKTKFKIDGLTYLRHKGYDFMSSPIMPESVPED